MEAGKLAGWIDEDDWLSFLADCDYDLTVCEALLSSVVKENQSGGKERPRSQHAQQEAVPNEEAEAGGSPTGT
jgi:hypothetical protein